MGRPLKFKSPEELEVRIKEYFSDCDKKGKPYTITGLAIYLDCDRDTLLNYEEREEYFGTIKRAKMKCQNYAEEYLYLGKNVTGAIFNLKNNYGWVDKTETDWRIKELPKPLLGGESVKEIDSGLSSHDSDSQNS